MNSKLVLFTLLFACFLMRNADALEDKQDNKAIPIIAHEVKEKALSEFQVFTGRTQFILEEIISSELDGIVINLPYKKGDKISRGQIVAQLMWNDINNEDNEKKCNESFSENYSLSSPVDGVIGKVHVSKGQKIKQSDPIVTVLDSLMVKTTISGDGATLFRMGSSCAVLIEEIDSTYEAVVHVVSDQMAEIRLKNSDRRINPGMTAAISVLTEKKALLAPSDLIYNDDGRSYVFVFRNNKIQKTYVKLGLVKGKEIVVLSGLQAGDMIFPEPQMNLETSPKKTNLIEFKDSKTNLKPIKAKPASIGYNDRGFSISGLLQSLFPKTSQLDGIADHFNALPSFMPLAKSSSSVFYPNLEVRFNFNNEIGIGLNLKHMQRHNDMKGNSSVLLSNLIEKYHYTTNSYDESYTGFLIRGYYYFVNNDLLGINVNVGAGVVFGSFKHINQLSYSLRDSSQLLHYFTHSGNIEASGNGLSFFLGAEIEYKLNELVSVLSGIGFNSILLNNWKGYYQYEYSFEAETLRGTDSGNLYYVVYGAERYFWILNSHDLAVLEKDTSYQIEPADFFKGKNNFQLHIGLRYRFGSR